MIDRLAASRTDQERGFTLVELLVALALLGFLSVLMFSGMHFGVKSWGRSQEHVQGTDEVRIAQNLLRTVLGGAYPLFLMNNPTDPRVDFAGSADRIELLAPPPAAMSAGGLARYVFTLNSHDGRTELALSIQPELASDQTELRNDVLISGLKSMSFSYLGSALAARSGWQQQWQDQKQLPRLIRIEAAFFANDARLWPELYVAPQIDVDVGCSYDPLTRYCRGRSR